jgi:hypothetical protein
MAVTRVFDEAQRTVQLLYKGWPITPHMKMDSPEELLNELSVALEVAYRKIRDAKID